MSKRPRDEGAPATGAGAGAGAGGAGDSDSTDLKFEDLFRYNDSTDLLGECFQ